MILDLSKYASTVGTYSAEDADQALAERSRPMEAGVHEVKIVGFRVLKGTSNEGILVIAKDPAWAMFMPVMENAGGQQSSVCVMMPLTDVLVYAAPGKKETSYPFQGFMKFLQAIGFCDPEINGERSEAVFMRRIVATNGDALNDLVGMQLKLKAFWRPDMWRPMWDNESKAYYIVDANGNIPHASLDEPFILDKELPPKSRWLEMENKCTLAGGHLQTQLEFQVEKHDTVKNDISKFVAVKRAAPRPVVMTATAKPAARVIGNPKPVVAMEDIIDDEPAF